MIVWSFGAVVVRRRKVVAKKAQDGAVAVGPWAALAFTGYFRAAAVVSSSR